MSIAQSQKIASKKVTFFHFFFFLFLRFSDAVGTRPARKRGVWKLKSLTIRDLRARGGRGRKSLVLNGLGHRKRPAETKWRKTRRGALLVMR